MFQPDCILNFIDRLSGIQVTYWALKTFSVCGALVVYYTADYF